MQKQIWLGLVVALAIAVEIAPGAIAQPLPQAPISLATPPVLALPSDNMLLCAINLAPGNSSPQETISFQFERHFRDTHTLLQHSDKSSPRYASAGRLMFGLENDWVWLGF